MAVSNSTILENIWLNGTNDYQQRIPKETINDMAAAVTYLFDPQNFDLYNQFVNSLINRIGATYIHQQAWRNKLAAFKKPNLNWGDKLQEIAVKWVRSHAYKDIPDVEALFGDYRPEAAVWFHKVNRQEYYPITVNDEELRMAFAGDGESEGLNAFIAQVMEAPISSDEYDEYRIMMQLFAYYDEHLGFYNRNLNAIPSDIEDSTDSAKTLLKMVKADAEKLAFPSSRYRSTKIDALSDVPCFARPEELIFLTTPEVRSAIDVDALMSAFHMEKGEIQERVVTVDEFPMDGVGAILTTQDFFQCRNRIYRNTSQYNALTLSTNYFLHHWGIYSVSPVVPAICYTTRESSVLNTVTQETSGMTLSAESDYMLPGETQQLTIELSGTLTNDDDSNYDGSAISVAPNAATFLVYVVRATTVDNVTTYSAVNSPQTRVDRNMVLHAGDNLIDGDEIYITATSAYINPSGDTTTYTDNIQVIIGTDSEPA